MIPGLKEEEKEEMKEWMRRDREYEGVFRRMKERIGEEVRVEVREGGRGWWEKDSGGVDEVRNGGSGGGQGRRRGEKFQISGLKGGRDDRVRRKAGRREGFKL